MTLQLFLDPSALLTVSRSFPSFPTYLSTQPRMAEPFLIVSLRTLPRGGDIETIRLAASRAILDTGAFRSCNDSAERSELTRRRIFCYWRRELMIRPESVQLGTLGRDGF